MKELIKRIKNYDKLTGFTKITRRYFIMNSFDGVLTGLGILLGCWSSGIRDVHTILLLCSSTAIALGFSGATGAYLAEESERLRERRDLEKQLMRELKEDNIVSKAHSFATKIIALVNALTPFSAVLILATPFLIIKSIENAYFTAIILSFALLFGLGMFLGKESKTSLIGGGLKMLFAGIATLIVMQLLNGFQ